MSSFCSIRQRHRADRGGSAAMSHRRPCHGHRDCGNGSRAGAVIVIGSRRGAIDHSSSHRQPRRCLGGARTVANGSFLFRNESLYSPLSRRRRAQRSSGCDSRRMERHAAAAHRCERVQQLLRSGIAVCIWWLPVPAIRELAASVLQVIGRPRPRLQRPVSTQDSPERFGDRPHDRAVRGLLFQPVLLRTRFHRRRRSDAHGRRHRLITERA